MSHLQDFARLLGAGGLELLDLAAELTGKPRPSQLAHPLISPEPVLLDRAIGDWKQAAEGMTFRLTEFEQQVGLVLQAWEAPPGFLTYTAGVGDVMKAQQAAMNEISQLLKDVQKALDDDKKATQRKIENAVTAVVGAMFGAGAAFVAALAFPPAEAAIGPIAWTAFITALGAIISGVVAWLIASRQSSDDRAETWKDKLDGLRDIAEGSRLRQLTPPSMPDLSSVTSLRLINA